MKRTSTGSAKSLSFLKVGLNFVKKGINSRKFTSRLYNTFSNRKNKSTSKKDTKVKIVEVALDGIEYVLMTASEKFYYEINISRNSLLLAKTLNNTIDSGLLKAHDWRPRFGLINMTNQYQKRNMQIDGFYVGLANISKHRVNSSDAEHFIHDNFHKKYGADVMYGNAQSYDGTTTNSGTNPQSLLNFGWRLFSDLPQKLKDAKIVHNIQFGKRPIAHERFHVLYGITILGT